MNILVLNGSPKVKSDTMRLTRSFLSGITAEIPCEINVVDVIQKRVLPCLGCFSCWANGMENVSSRMIRMTSLPPTLRQTSSSGAFRSTVTACPPISKPCWIAPFRC